MTSIAVFCMIVSGGAGALVSPFVVKQNMSLSAGKDAVFVLLIFQGSIIAVIMLLNLIFFRGKPNHPPS